MKHLLLILVVTAHCWAQSMLNASRGIPQPNDPTGTTLYSTAIVNAAGNAATAQIGNTTVPVRVVIGGAGTTGNAVLASTGTLAPCTMDAAVTSGGNFFVIESTVNPGQCHPQSAAPTVGTWVIGYLHDATTTAGSTALVHVNGYSYGSAGGSGTVSPNSGSITQPVAAYQAAGGSTTVQPMTTAANTSSGLQVSQINFASSITAAPEIAFQRTGAYVLSLGTSGLPGNAGGMLRTADPCPSGTTDISFTTTAGGFCTGRTFPAISPAQNWVVHCVVPWTFTAGSGTATVAFGITLGGAPSAASTWTGVIYGTGTPGTTPAVYQGTTISSNGNQPIVSITGMTIAIGTIYSTTIDGTFSVGTSGSNTFGFYATTSAGTGAIKAGAYCITE